MKDDSLIGEITHYNYLPYIFHYLLINLSFAASNTYFNLYPKTLRLSQFRFYTFTRMKLYVHSVMMLLTQ